MPDPTLGETLDFIRPVRIQRKRTKGWRMPEGAVYVGRPTRWGNTYRADEFKPGDMRDPVGMYRHDCDLAETFTPARFEKWIAPLRGKNLVCWCRLDQPCHADVLLELANA